MPRNFETTIAAPLIEAATDTAATLTAHGAAYKLTDPKTGAPVYDKGRLSQTDKKGVPLAGLAAIYDHASNLSTILSTTNDPNARAKSEVLEYRTHRVHKRGKATAYTGLTPAHLAAMFGSKNAMQVLLDHKKLDINARQEADGMTPLLYAARNAHGAVVTQLLEHKDTHITARDVNRYNVMHQLVLAKHRLKKPDPAAGAGGLAELDNPTMQDPTDIDPDERIRIMQEIHKRSPKLIQQKGDDEKTPAELLPAGSQLRMRVEALAMSNQAAQALAVKIIEQAALIALKIEKGDNHKPLHLNKDKVKTLAKHLYQTTLRDLMIDNEGLRIQCVDMFRHPDDISQAQKNLVDTLAAAYHRGNQNLFKTQQEERTRGGKTPTKAEFQASLKARGIVDEEIITRATEAHLAARGKFRKESPKDANKDHVSINITATSRENVALPAINTNTIKDSIDSINTNLPLASNGTPVVIIKNSDLNSQIHSLEQYVNASRSRMDPVDIPPGIDPAKTGLDSRPAAAGDPNPDPTSTLPISRTARKGDLPTHGVDAPTPAAAGGPGAAPPPPPPPPGPTGVTPPGPSTTATTGSGNTGGSNKRARPNKTIEFNANELAAARAFIFNQDNLTNSQLYRLMKHPALSKELVDEGKYSKYTEHTQHQDDNGPQPKGSLKDSVTIRGAREQIATATVKGTLTQDRGGAGTEFVAGTAPHPTRPLAPHQPRPTQDILRDGLGQTNVATIAKLAQRIVLKEIKEKIKKEEDITLEEIKYLGKCYKEKHPGASDQRKIDDLTGALNRLTSTSPRPMNEWKKADVVHKAEKKALGDLESFAKKSEKSR